MAKKQGFLNKSMKKGEGKLCPVCDGELQRIKHVKAVRADNGAWRFRSANIAVCKCNEKEIYT